jgi:Nif-specific regulatory protein
MDHTVSPEILLIKVISSVIVHERDPKQLLEKVLGALKREMGMLRGTFTIRQGDTLSIEVSQGLGDANKLRGKYRLGEGVTGRVAETGRPEIVADTSRDKRFLNRTGAREGNEQVSFICVPIFHRNEVIGTLSIDRAVGATDDDLAREADLLGIVGNLTADAVCTCVAEQEERESLLEENRKLRDMLAPDQGELVGNCREMQQIYALVRQVAPSDATVLIRGSTGTGKELIARAIVRLSPRKGKPFVTLNCAAMPEALVESELFGHEKGAFTGAAGRRIGRAEAADGGTLFLDEIGDMTLQTQVKLLRFIQERTFSRVGSNEELHSNVRFIAATSRNLEQMMEQKAFREDLYYRLNIFPILMPDLAKRRSDIVLLAEHFIDKMNLKYGRKVVRLSTPAINMLMAYHWPGNVRELENCIEHAVLTAADDCIHAYNLPQSLQTGKASGTCLLPDGNASLDVMVASYERELIVEAIKRNKGNLSAAGRELGVSPRMMHYRINKLGITPE